jgi:hypothetical protein
MKFNVHFHVEIESFEENGGDKTDYSEIDQITSQMELAGQNLGLTLRRFLSQFEGQYVKGYLNGLSEIESRHYLGTSEIVESSYNGHFKSFFELYQKINLDRLSECLENPTRSGE